MKSFNEIMDFDTDIGIAYDFKPLTPTDHMALINKALNLFGEAGLYLLIGRVESAGNNLTETTFFIQAMQSLLRTDPEKVTEFQILMLSKIVRKDLNDPSGKEYRLTADGILQFSEFNYIPGIMAGKKKKDGSVITAEEEKTIPTLLLYRLTIAALSEYISPFVSMLMSSDISRKIQTILTDSLRPTHQTSTGSSGDQSEQDSSPQEAKDVKRGRSHSGIFTKRSR